MLCNRVEDHIRENKVIWCLIRKQIGKSKIYQFNIKGLLLRVGIKRKEKVSFSFPKAKKNSMKTLLFKTQMKKMEVFSN